MASSAYTRKRNPYRQLQDPLGGQRNLSECRFKQSIKDQQKSAAPRIIPDIARLVFTISLTSIDDNRTLVQYIGMVVVKTIVKTTIKISGNEVMSIDDSDIFMVYLWKTQNCQYQGIDLSTNHNATKLELRAGNGDGTLPFYLLMETGSISR